MHYYSFHIGDYRAATAHLTNEEDLAYRRLIDMYYDTELPIPTDLVWVARRLRVSIDAVRSVLEDMFYLTDAGWDNERCSLELKAYKRMIEGGRHGAAKRWAKGGDTPPILTPNEPQCQPITNNHKPRTKNQSSSRATRLPTDWWPSEILEKWAKSERPELDFKSLTEGFIDFWLSKATNATKLDWDATFRNWVRNQKTVGKAKAENLKLTEHGERAVRVMDSWLKGKEQEDGQAKIC